MSNDKNIMLTRDSEDRATPEFRAMDRLLESVFGETPAFGSRYASAGAGIGWMPAVDIRETDTDLVVYAAVPGLAKEDVNLEVKDNTLVLSGRIKGRGSEEDAWVRRELPRGDFYRAFSLPSDVQSAKVTATMRDGVLEIRLPKADEARPRRISIG